MGIITLMVFIGNGSFAPQRRIENAAVSNLAEQGLLLGGNITIEAINAFALTRNLNPLVVTLMYQQAGLLDANIPIYENDHFPNIFK